MTKWQCQGCGLTTEDEDMDQCDQCGGSDFHEVDQGPMDQDGPDHMDQLKTELLAALRELRAFAVYHMPEKFDNADHENSVVDMLMRTDKLIAKAEAWITVDKESDNEQS